MRPSDSDSVASLGLSARSKHGGHGALLLPSILLLLALSGGPRGTPWSLASWQESARAGAAELELQIPDDPVSGIHQTVPGDSLLRWCTFESGSALGVWTPLAWQYHASLCFGCDVEPATLVVFGAEAASDAAAALVAVHLPCSVQKLSMLVTQHSSWLHGSNLFVKRAHEVSTDFRIWVATACTARR